MDLLARKVKRPKPLVEWRHYHLLGTLRRFGNEVGFSLPTISDGAASSDRAGAPNIRVHVYRRGVKQGIWAPAYDPTRRNIVVWQSEWEGVDAADLDEEDLIAVEYTGSAASHHRAIEAQIMWRRKGASEYGTVIIETVRLRPPAYRFSPIVHAAYYYGAEDPRENFTCLLSFKGDDANAHDENEMHIDFYARSGAKLGSRSIRIPVNSANLLSLQDGLSAIDVSPLAVADGVVAHFRGGSSQFAIYTITSNHRSGVLGIEHSLAPHAFIYSMAMPEVRARVLQHVMSGLQ